MKAHAPGPWTFTDGGDRRHKEFAIMAEGGKIASVYAGFGSHFDWETSEANARLIAAAPELLEALKEWQRLDQLKGLDRNLRDTMKRLARNLTRDAIRKAEDQS